MNDSLNLELVERAFLEAFAKKLSEMGASEAEMNMECGTFTFKRK